MTRCQIVPAYLLERLAAGRLDADAARRAQAQAATDPRLRTLRIDRRLRDRRGARATAAPRPRATGEAPFSVFTAGNGNGLPGTLVRAASDPPSGDQAVDEAHAGVEASLALFADVYGRSSFDDAGAPVLATVHYEIDYDNAFWDGEQLVFGDGDGEVFERFTKPVDVLAHELTHAVTQHAANLSYEGQSGALNESVSDVFGSCLKQWLLGQSVEEADWLIGEGIFTPSVNGRALRSMKEPGTAYDDPALGRDPQVGSMPEFVETAEDNGGVHLNSGIPNRAFHLAAVAMGGTSAHGAGRIWYAALTSGLAADTDFRQFAAATVAAAGQVSEAAVDAVGRAWAAVGVVPAPAVPRPSRGAGGTGGLAPRGTPEPEPRAESSAAEAESSAAVVAVTRSGGVAGVRQRGEVLLGDDPRTPEVESLLGRIDLLSMVASTPAPDRFVYTFSVRGEEVTLGEHDLTPDLQDLASLLLR